MRTLPGLAAVTLAACALAPTTEEDVEQGRGDEVQTDKLRIECGGNLPSELSVRGTAYYIDTYFWKGGGSSYVFELSVPSDDQSVHAMGIAFDCLAGSLESLDVEPPAIPTHGRSSRVEGAGKLRIKGQVNCEDGAGSFDDSGTFGLVVTGTAINPYRCDEYTIKGFTE